MHLLLKCATAADFIRIVASLMSLISLISCSTPPLRIQSDDVPAGSLRVAQIIGIAQRDVILNLEAYPAIITAGVPDSDLVDGSVAMARVYCCGGPTKETSAEYANRRMLYVPRGLSVELEDFVEVRVGRPPEHGDGGRLNTVTRVVARNSDQVKHCWWEPKNDTLWLRYPFCEWMPQAGWVQQGGLSPAWFKPAP